MAYPTLFNEKRTAQAAAFMLHRAGGRLPLLKLMKLMYLAERESLRVHGEPITGDKLVSLPHGPVLSMTYDFMNKNLKCTAGGWDTWIENRSGHDLALKDPSMIRSPEQDLLELSEGDQDILEEIWQKFGHMSQFELRDYTHSDASLNCATTPTATHAPSGRTRMGRASQLRWKHCSVLWDIPQKASSPRSNICTIKPI